MISSRFSGKRILLANSNHGKQLLNWHVRGEHFARALGLEIETFSMLKLHPYTIFPYLDRKLEKRDPTLMQFYEILGEKIASCDMFTHYNGALIHPELMHQFKQLKI
jgi:hypothetical protein